MAEKEEGYEGEESEYQFTDDQINYEIEEEDEEAKSTEAPKSKVQNIIEKLGPYRRMIIGISVFFVILLIVYFMLTPSVTPPTDFTPNATPGPITETPPQAKQASATMSSPPSSEVATPQSQPIQPVAPSAPQPVASQVAPTVSGTQPISTAPSAVPITSANGTPTSAMPPPPLSAVPTQPTVPLPTVPVQGQPLNPPPAIPSDLANKISELETQNANMMTMIQTQFGQKMADYELQTKALQERVQVLNKRLANMEATLNKMAQIVRDGGMIRTRTTTVSTRTAEPRLIFAVQAIIPGRAWLKSESGDTVTVAEGDLLKDYGRVVKIDPYDGVVQIDNGNRIITLSYGMSGD